MDDIISLIVAIIFLSFFVILCVLLILLSNKKIELEKDFIESLSDDEKLLICKYNRVVNVSFRDLKKKDKEVK